MTALMWTGSLVGALFGLAHAAYIYRAISAQAAVGTSENHTRAVYFALWIFVLWVLFGSYVLVLWLVGAMLYIVFKMFR